MTDIVRIAPPTRALDRRIVRFKHRVDVLPSICFWHIISYLESYEELGILRLVSKSFKRYLFNMKYDIFKDRYITNLDNDLFCDIGLYENIDKEADKEIDSLSVKLSNFKKSIINYKKSFSKLNFLYLKIFEINCVDYEDHYKYCSKISIGIKNFIKYSEKFDKLNTLSIFDGFGRFRDKDIINFNSCLVKKPLLLHTLEFDSCVLDNISLKYLTNLKILSFKSIILLRDCYINDIPLYDSITIKFADVSLGTNDIDDKKRLSKILNHFKNVKNIYLELIGLGFTTNIFNKRINIVSLKIEHCDDNKYYMNNLYKLKNLETLHVHCNKESLSGLEIYNLNLKNLILISDSSCNTFAKVVFKKLINIEKLHINSYLFNFSDLFYLKNLKVLYLEEIDSFNIIYLNILKNKNLDILYLNNIKYSDIKLDIKVKYLYLTNMEEDDERNFSTTFFKENIKNVYRCQPPNITDIDFL